MWNIHILIELCKVLKTIMNNNIYEWTILYSYENRANTNRYNSDLDFM